MNPNKTPTQIPDSYPELVDEQWRSLEDEHERTTVIPSPAVQLGLELECADLTLDVVWVD